MRLFILLCLCSLALLANSVNYGLDRTRETDQPNPFARKVNVRERSTPRPAPGSVNPKLTDYCRQGSTNQAIVFQDPKRDELLHVYTLPVGQGDCRIIECPTGEITVFDCGSTYQPTQYGERGVKDFLSRLNKRPDRVVRNIIVSHCDVDHFNLISKLFPAGAENIYLSKGTCTNRAFQKWTDKHQKPIHYINGGRPCGGGSKHSCPEIIDICPEIINKYPEIKGHILSANHGEKPADSNLDSILMKLVWKHVSVLFTGDIENKTPNAKKGLLTDIIKNQRTHGELKSTVYMVSHHGASNKANTHDWLSAIAPNVAIVSGHPCGRYGHPKCKTIDNLKKLRTIQYRHAYLGQQSTLACGNDDREIEFRTQNDKAIYSTFSDKNTYSIIDFSTDGTKIKIEVKLNIGG